MTFAQRDLQSNQLTWALCVSTLNRIDALEECVRCALNQTRPPSELIVVDASDAWLRHKEHISRLAGEHGVPVNYLRAERRSLPHQRNQGARTAVSDILFMIDDDAFMHRECAERIMAAYEADRNRTVGAIGCKGVAERPGSTGLTVEGRDDLTSRSSIVADLLANSRIVRFLWREVFLMSPDLALVPYDGQRPTLREEARRLAHPNCIPVRSIAGFALTVRRDIVLKEPFEQALLSYSPTEDIEACYRFTRHAANAVVTDALIYHHHASVGRLKRRQVSELTMANVAFFVRKRSRNFRVDAARYYILALRRVLAEALKDGISRRFSFPQLRGTISGVGHSFAIFRAERDTIDDWYQALQMRILDVNPRVRKVPPEAWSPARLE